MNIDLGMIKSMSTMMGIKIPEAEDPTNRISEFIEVEIDKILPEDANPEIVDMIKGIYIRLTNRDPNSTLQTLITIHQDIGELVRELQMEQYVDAHPTADINEEEEEDASTEE